MAAFDAAGVWPALYLPDALASPQGTGILRWATAGYLSAMDDAPASTFWQPRLLADVEISQSASDAASLGGVLSLGIGAIGLDDADDALSALSQWGTADGRRVTVTVIPVEDAQRGDAGTPLAGRTLGMQMDLSTGIATILRTDPEASFIGIVQRIDQAEGSRGTLRITDVVERLATPLQPTTYAGTGGVEGGDDLKGKPKPVALGRVSQAEPVALGDVDLGVGIGALPTYQVHWRQVAEIGAVRVRGVEQTLVGGAPSIGQAREFPALGMFQLGGAPDGAVTADVRGDAVGGYVSSLGGVLRRLVGSLGPQLGADDIDAVAFAFAEADLPGEIGWYQGAEETTCATVAAGLVASCGAVLSGGRRGRLRLWDPIASGIDQFSLTMPHILALRPVVRPDSIRPLPREVAIQWRPNWTVLSDIAGSVPDTDRARLASRFSGPARTNSTPITTRVAQQRTLTFAGLYWAQADAQARANAWRAWLQGAPEMFEVTTDRYLGQIECGHMGRIAYPAWGLGNGVRVTVIGWAENLATRRLTMTVITQPET
jgi:hypothetical protein